MVGLLITFQSPIKIELTPELILALFVPPLVFEAAFHLNLMDLRRNLPAILLLAVPGVILTTFIVGGMLVLGINLSLPIALVFGALIAATDPVSVVALFRTLGVPKRLSVLIEGESLFNDGTAIVLFNLMLAVALTGKFNLADSVVDFFVISIGGILVGLVLGWLIAQLIARVDNYLIETTLTTVLAFGSYLIAERFGVSGVLAVVAAGLVNGNISPTGDESHQPDRDLQLLGVCGFPRQLSDFPVIGITDQYHMPCSLPGSLFYGQSWQCLVARFIVVYGLSWLGNRVSEPIPIQLAAYPQLGRICAARSAWHWCSACPSQWDQSVICCG